MIIRKETFGATTDGRVADLYSLANDEGMTVRLTNLGATIVSVVVPDRSGQPEDVVLGYDTAAAYARDPFYFGATVGRVANRIGGGRLVLGKRCYTLACNEGTCHLHGGDAGFNRVFWKAEQVRSADGCGVAFRYQSAAGEEGYPGNLAVSVTFLLQKSNALQIVYHATTDRDTVVNLTNHTYFNLAGAGCGDIRGHHLRLFADRFTPVDCHLIPTGELRPVAGTPFDFRQPRAMGERMPAADRQLQLAGGYDHNYILNRASQDLCQAAVAGDPDSGRVLEVHTTQPGIQFYSGNSIADGTRGKKGRWYKRLSGFCLETQHFPDSPNHPEFPPVLLRAGETYRQETVYRFSVGHCQ